MKKFLVVMTVVITVLVVLNIAVSGVGAAIRYGTSDTEVNEMNSLVKDVHNVANNTHGHMSMPVIDGCAKLLDEVLIAGMYTTFTTPQIQTDWTKMVGQFKKVTNDCNKGILQHSTKSLIQASKDAKKADTLVAVLKKEL